MDERVTGRMGWEDFDVAVQAHVRHRLSAERLSALSCRPLAECRRAMLCEAYAREIQMKIGGEWSI